MTHPLKIVFKTVGALFIGALLALGSFQEDPWLKQRFERMFRDSIAGIIGVPFKVKLSRLDLLSGHVLFEEIQAEAQDGSWSISCPAMHMRFSWLSYLRYRGFATELIFEKPQIVTRYENKKLAAQDPFLAIIRAPTDLPIVLTNCTLQHATMNIASSSGTLAFVFSSVTDIQPQSVRTNLFCADGTLLRNPAGTDPVGTDLVGTSVAVGSSLPAQLIEAVDAATTDVGEKNKIQLTPLPLAHHLAGSISIDVPQDKPENYLVKMHIGADLPFVQQAHKRSVALGTYRQGKASVTWYPEDRSLLMTADTIEITDDGITAQLEIAGAIKALAAYVPAHASLKTAEGKAFIKGTVALTDAALSYDGTATLEEWGFSGVTLKTMELAFTGDTKHVEGTARLQHGGVSLGGSWNYGFAADEFKTAFALENKVTAIPHVVLEKAGTRGSLVFRDGKLKGDCLVTATYLGDKKALIKSTLEVDSRRAHLKGTVNNAPFALVAVLDPFRLESCLFKDLSGKQMLAFNAITDSSGNGMILDSGLKGTVNVDLVKEIVRSIGGYQLSGQGLIDVILKRVSSGAVLQINAQDVHIKVPSSHNFIKGFHGKLAFDTTQRNLVATDCLVELHKGSCSTSQATASFSDTGLLEFMHLPVQGHHLFINWHKDFFGTLSGGLTALLTGGRWSCQGTLMIDKAQLRSNLLSSKVQKELLKSSANSFGKEVDLDIRVQTLRPVQVKTPFFQTQVQVVGQLKGTAAKPLVTGQVELLQGSFAFPYKPLYITSGKLNLTPQHPDDPLIELTAKNTLKKYTITMHVSGSLRRPHISFNASPHLSEQSILTLLLAGSEEGSLYLAMPSMVMMHVESLLFGSDEKLTKAQQFFKGLLKPLKNVRIVPATDGNGLKGSIEVDINERLRAKAQNNLALTDETQVEVEYALSDDMSVKAIRDESGSIGGELEMRWKF